MRTFYRFLLWLHPPEFRRQFAGEMQWIFDQSAESEGALCIDGLGSLARQWLLRSGWWKIALAMVLAMVQITAGGFGMMLFGRRHLIEPSYASPVALYPHQPLTVAMVMYLAVFVAGGLTVMVIGLTFWMKKFSRGVR